MKRILATALMMSSAAIATPSMAAEVIYTDQAAFEAAAGMTTTEDFEDATLAPGLTFTSDAGSVSGGVFDDRLVRGGDETTFTFLTPITAFGAIFNLAPGGAGQGIEFTLTPGGLVGTEVPDSFSGQFFGFISDTAFTSVTLRGGTQGGSAETYNLDNLQFGFAAAGAVPEPTTWLMFILGFGFIGAAMRRKKSVKTTVSYA